MSGVDTPPVVTQPFGSDAGGAYITLPIPIAPSTSGLASFEEGFPPATMTPIESGGIAPSGADMNGILYTLSAWCAMLQAGQWPEYDEDVATAISGYAVGAVVRDGLVTYTNAVDGNEDDPADDLSGWVSSVPVHAAVSLTGTQNNYALPGPSDLFLDVTTTGATTFNGFDAQRDGQRLIISNLGAFLLTIAALNGGSSAANQVRAPSDLAIIQNQTITLTYSEGAAKWLVA